MAGNFFFSLPEMVRLEAAAMGARMAGRAALVAIWEARREAKTREAAIAMVVGGESGVRRGS